MAEPANTIEPLLAFNGKFKFVEANTDFPDKWFNEDSKKVKTVAPHLWEINEIFFFLELVITEYEYFGVPTASENLVDLKKIIENLRKISLPTGTDLKNRSGADDFAPPGAAKKPFWKDYQPNQHIPRKPNPEWKDKDATKPPERSKFFLSPYKHYLREWLTPYDLLGLFISKLGPPPAAANMNNYFVPLLYIYIRWSPQLGSKTKQKLDFIGIGNIPAMYQCTWVLDQDQKIVDHLFGTSFSGHPFPAVGSPLGITKKELWGNWEYDVRYWRWKLLNPQILQNAGYGDFETAPMRELTKHGLTGTYYGNCAETYAYKLLDEHNGKGYKFFGCAINSRAVTLDVYKFEDKDTPELGANSFKTAPCINCQAYIGQYTDIDGRNFLIPEEDK